MAQIEDQEGEESMPGFRTQMDKGTEVEIIIPCVDREKRPRPFRAEVWVRDKAELGLKTRPDSPCESGMQPRVPVTPGEENSVLDISE